MKTVLLVQYFTTTMIALDTSETIGFSTNLPTQPPTNRPHPYAHGPLIPSQVTTLPALFADTAARHSDRPAVVWNGRSTTYRELADLANRVAVGLRTRGIGPGDFVGLLVPKSVELYAGMLGILKTGAAYVPLDPSFPADRLAYILADCGATVLLTGDAPALADWTGTVVPAADLLTGRTTGFVEPAIEPESTAYAIYTSGTTGRPKGVLVPHRAIGHLIQSERHLFSPTPDDRVLQGFSVAFDASLEEIWLAWANGGALVPAPEATMKTPDALGMYLAANEITIFSTVPTLLALLERPVPSVRLLILGGEVCPAELLRAWGGANRQIVNTYGPTETAVIATACTYQPGHPLTIGRPIPNYTVWVMDEQRRILPPGEPGELVIGGLGVTTGYLNRPDLTADKFITGADPDGGDLARLYRTGDLGRYNADGEIEFLGRIDTQVKLRGYRIELAEIEAQLLQYPHVRNAVVALKQADGVDRLVAYVVTDDHAPLPTDAVRTFLAARLASYMLPAQIVTLDAFPLLTSGKVDRNALPYPVATPDQPVTRSLVAPRTDAEAAVQTVFAKRLAPEPVSVDDDFFDLGGNSLLASLVVSELRRDARFALLSVRDLYTHRTVAQLAALADRPVTPVTGRPAEPIARPAAVAGWIKTVTAALQLLALFSFYAVPAAGFYAVLITNDTLETWEEWHVGLLALGLYVFIIPAYALLVVAAKWLILGRYRAGTYPLWGWYYLRFWFVKKLTDTLPLVLLSGTPYLVWLYRLLGARIGRGVHLGSSRLTATDLITVGDGASVAKEAALLGYRVQDGQLIVGPVTVGAGAYVGLRSVIEPGGIVGDGAVLDDLSLLPSNVTIPAGATWQGSPAQPTDALARPAPTGTPTGRARVQLVLSGALALMLILPALAVLPGAVLYGRYVQDWSLWVRLVALWPLAALYVVSLMGLLVLVKRMLAGRLPEGRFSLNSLSYVRYWLSEAVISVSLTQLKALYATIYTPSWMRWLGARVGRGSEISTVNHVDTDQLFIGDGVFLADSVSVGAARIQDGWVTLRPTRIGDRSFVGNSAVLGGGTTIGSGCLIGALSTTPAGSVPDATDWVGSPAMRLPARPRSQTKFPDHLTYAPPRRLVWLRGGIELLKITIPILFISLTAASLLVAIQEADDDTLGPFVLICTSVLLSTVLILTGLTIGLKWLLIGRYRPSEKPLWDSFVWRNEFVNSLCENYVYPYLVGFLLGTPFAPWFFRLLGARFGRGVYLETFEMTEFDLVSVGDGAAINAAATVQTHLFEDRIMKMSNLTVGAGATVGASSVVLYDTEIEAGATLGSLSLLMKGEHLPARTVWQGIPSTSV